MCKWCKTNKYRKIYENHVGPIPIDESNKSYEIHHIDGNRSNNSIDNLKCVSLQEHYDIHASQNDWWACVRIGIKLGKSAEQISKDASEANRKRLSEGVHIFQTDKFKELLSENSRKNALRRSADGTNPFLDKEKAKEWAKKRVEDGVYRTKEYKETCRRRNKISIENGTNPFSIGKNPSKIQVTCIHCGKIGGKSNMTRWHLDRCKFKKL